MMAVVVWERCGGDGGGGAGVMGRVRKNNKKVWGTYDKRERPHRVSE